MSRTILPEQAVQSLTNLFDLEEGTVQGLWDRLIDQDAQLYGPSTDPIQLSKAGLFLGLIENADQRLKYNRSEKTTLCKALARPKSQDLDRRTKNGLAAHDYRLIQANMPEWGPVLSSRIWKQRYKRTWQDLEEVAVGAGGAPRPWVSFNLIMACRVAHFHQTSHNFNREKDLLGPEMDLLYTERECIARWAKASPDHLTASYFLTLTHKLDAQGLSGAALKAMRERAFQLLQLLGEIPRTSGEFYPALLEPTNYIFSTIDMTTSRWHGLSGDVFAMAYAFYAQIGHSSTPIVRTVADLTADYNFFLYGELKDLSCGGAFTKRIQKLVDQGILYRHRSSSTRAAEYLLLKKGMTAPDAPETSQTELEMSTEDIIQDFLASESPSEAPSANPLEATALETPLEKPFEKPFEPEIAEDTLSLLGQELYDCIAAVHSGRKVKLSTLDELVASSPYAPQDVNARRAEVGKACATIVRQNLAKGDFGAWEDSIWDKIAPYVDLSLMTLET